MALAVGVGAEPSKEQSCDVVGDESSESQMEKALLKKLEPLSQMRYSTGTRQLAVGLGVAPCPSEGQAERSVWGQTSGRALPLVWAVTGFPGLGSLL